MSFSELNLSRPIVAGLERMGIREPRAIQAQAIPSVRAGRDVIGLAQTGTGKTAAYLAPVLDRILSDKPSAKSERVRPRRSAERLRALVLCPTRELAQQVERDAEAMSRGLILNTLVAYGKVSLTKQADALKRPVDLLVATPGRVRELLDANALDLSFIQTLIIDEADRMMDMGFLPQVKAILNRLPARRQTCLFTATMPRDVEALAQEFLDHPIRVEVGRHTTPVEHLSQHLIATTDTTKVAWLIDLVQERGKRGVLVFCRTRRRVGWVAGALHRHGVSVGMLHGDRSQAQRQRALDRFAAGELPVLVATDVAARGLHVPAVRTVVNYDLPMQPEEYVHRIGRAGHGMTGPSASEAESYTLWTPRDSDRWETIAGVTDTFIELEVIDPFAPPLHAGDDPDAASRSKKKDRRRRGSSDKRGHHMPDPITKRGKIKRRRGRSRPIDKSQKPGKGITSRRQDRKGDS